jgi:enoyl-CoA hydratase/carnithine racemase
MSAGQPPELVVEGHVATITLRRPAQANRLEIEDLQRLLELFAQVNANVDVLVLRLASTGRTFCAGFNIGSVGAEGVDAGSLFAAVADAVESLRPVTIASIQGGVYGGATDLALACDFRIGTPACEMFVPAAKLGLLFYRSGLERYVSRLGLPVAKRLLLQADKFSAQQMLDCGFLDRLAPSGDELHAQVDGLAATLAGMAPLALLGMKKHLNRIARGTLDAAEFARDVVQADASDDLREGQLAWQQKRTPQFRGR